jgi:small subunit ribosomal protein S6
MPTTRVYNYEGMFVLNQTVAADFGGAIEHIREVLTRAGATILGMKKWDERRFAYEIQKQKRGVYILVFFSCPAPNLAVIERSCNLSEKILRTLIVRADHLSVDEMRAADAQKELEVEARLRAERPASAADEPLPGAAPARLPEPAIEAVGIDVLETDL